MPEKQGTAWIQNLSKQQVIEELKSRGIETKDPDKLDDLRRVLREKFKEEEQTVNKNVKMEYTANLDFKLGTDEWKEFAERIDLYFEANEIADENKKRAIFLTKIDAETYRIVRKVCAPKKPKETELKDIIILMENYLKPKLNETVLKQQFRERKQKIDESVGRYIATLRDLARKCKFKKEEEALRDQLITGIRNKATKVALFKVEKLTLDEAIKTALAIEGAKKAAESLESQPGEREDSDQNEDTHRIQSRSKYRERRQEGARRRDNGEV